MRSALSSIPGVQDVKVDYSAKTATVHVDKDAVPSEEAIVAALEKAGFGGSLKE